MPVFEFSCRGCGTRFEELVGSHVGVQIKDVRCPRCEGKELDRHITSAYSATTRSLTPNQKRRLEQKRGIDRGGAKERFKQQRAAERARQRPHGRGG